MLEVEGLVKDYPSPGGPLSVLRGVDLAATPGEAVSIRGPSGGGKSTLLYILGALETPTAGSVRLDGVDPFSLGTRELARFRNERVGFVFQDHCLLPQLTVLENVLTPTLVGPRRGGELDRARRLLERVGLADRMDHRPAELSGGEKQRVAIARGLVREPLLVLCDEPTGNLDPAIATSVGDLLLELVGDERRILVVVTHNDALADRFPRRLRLVDGRLAPA